MRPYEHLTDEQLLAEIADYRGAIKKIAMGESVAVVAGEGRRMEFVASNVDVARTELRELYLEAQIRGLSSGETGGAIPVEIG